MKIHFRLITIVFLLFLLSCKKNSADPKNNNGGGNNLSIAEKIAGSYTGIGKYLPGNINLGNTIVCIAPTLDYNSLYLDGAATINISKITDSTVKISLLSGPFPLETYDNILLKAVGNNIEFNDSLSVISRTLGVLARIEKNTGFFDPATNNISFSRVAPNFPISYSISCYSGLPYYTSSSVPDPVSGLMVFSNATIKRYVFSGKK